MALSQRSRGFTLIELLVVVSIIALLVSILLPSLGKAREQARIAVCMSNVRQISVAVMIYGADKGAYPNQGLSSNDGYGKSGLLPALLFRQGYLRSYTIWLCPSVKGGEHLDDWYSDTPPLGSDWTPAEWPPDYSHLCYGYNDSLFMRSSAWQAAHCSQSANIPERFNAHLLDSRAGKPPAKIAVSYDANWSTGGWALQFIDPYTGYSRLKFRHNDRLNASFLDGHVEPLPISLGMTVSLHRTYWCPWCP